MSRNWVIGLALTSGLVLFAQLSSAQTPRTDIEKACRDMFPNLIDYFSRRICVDEKSKEEKKAELARVDAGLRALREERARECIAGDLSRMEKLVLTSRDSLAPNLKAAEIGDALERASGYKSTTAIPQNNIRDIVHIIQIPTICPSEFYFLINVTAEAAGTIRWFNVWAENPPAGFTAGRQDKFYRDFEAERARAGRALVESEIRRAAEQAARDREKNAKALAERMQEALKNVIVSRVDFSCLFSACQTFSQFRITLINRSRERINSIGYGWSFLPMGAGSCPTPRQMKSQQLSIGPGETAAFEFSASGGLSLPQDRIVPCFRLTSVEVAP